MRLLKGRHTPEHRFRTGQPRCSFGRLRLHSSQPMFRSRRPAAQYTASRVEKREPESERKASIKGTSRWRSSGWAGPKRMTKHPTSDWPQGGAAHRAAAAVCISRVAPLALVSGGAAVPWDAASECAAGNALLKRGWEDAEHIVLKSTASEARLGQASNLPRGTCMTPPLHQAC